MQSPKFIDPPFLAPDPECHRVRKQHSKDLVKYLNEADVAPDKLCHYLELENCIVLKHEDKLKPFNLAKSYLEQKPGACWEEIVNLFCEDFKLRLLGLKIADDYKVDTRHCPKSEWN